MKKNLLIGGLVILILGMLFIHPSKVCPIGPAGERMKCSITYSIFHKGESAPVDSLEWWNYYHKNQEIDSLKRIIHRVSQN